MIALILASSSSSRRELLALSGLEFTVVKSDVDEIIESGLTPQKIVMSLARQKAQAVAAHYPQDVIIGCDTLVWIDGQILSKPADEESAFQMLRLLCGNTHYSYTGVCLISGNKERRFYEKTAIEFYPQSDAQIQAYVQTGESMGKAGGYSIMEGAATFARTVNGNFTSVLGLPLSRLLLELNEFYPGLMD